MEYKEALLSMRVYAKS